jgi:hypothetical protein
MVIFYCTVTFTIVLDVVAPAVAVTVMATGPAGVPALFVPVLVDVPDDVLPTPAHPVIINARQNAMLQRPNANRRCEFVCGLAVAATAIVASQPSNTIKGHRGLRCTGSAGIPEAIVVISVI